MANNFSKEMRVAFDRIGVGFTDALSVSKQVDILPVDPTEMERANDTLWIPVPHFQTDFDGSPGVDNSANFTSKTRLAVPATLTRSRAVAFTLNDYELRDPIQLQELERSATRKLASVINQAVINTIANEGSSTTIRTGAASGYADAANARAALTRIGAAGEKCIAFNPDDAIGMVGDIASRDNIVKGGMTGKAYEEAYMGRIANFMAFETEYSSRLAAAAGSGDTINTASGAADYTPLATSGSVNVDNRTQTITVSNTTGVKAGDRLRIANCEEVHMETKEPNGNPKTFVVRAVPTGTTLTISPPIIAASSSPTEAESAYKNCHFTATSGTAAITYLNSTTTSTNVYWQKESVKLIPGRYGKAASNDGNIMTATLPNGIAYKMERDRNINTLEDLIRVDVFFDVVNLCPEMNGVLLFNQT